MRLVVLFDRAPRPPVATQALVARTPRARARGLYGSGPLGPHDSMLFAWPLLVNEPFTMSGMLFPLDFVFLNQGGVVVDVATGVPPGVAVVRSRVPFQYALELPAGFVKTHGVEVGRRAAFRN